MGWLFMMCAFVLGVVSVGLFWLGLILGALGGFEAGDVSRMLAGSLVALLGVLGVALAVRAAALAGQVVRGEVRP